MTVHFDTFGPDPFKNDKDEWIFGLMSVTFVENICRVGYVKPSVFGLAFWITGILLFDNSHFVSHSICRLETWKVDLEEGFGN